MFALYWLTEGPTWTLRTEIGEAGYSRDALAAIDRLDSNKTARSSSLHLLLFDSLLR